MSDEERAARGGRLRPRGMVASATTREAMADEIATLERDCRRLYRQAVKKPVTNTPHAGEQLSGRLKAALALLDRAMKLRLQLDRLGGPVNGKEEASHDVMTKTTTRSSATRTRARDARAEGPDTV
jgi:hypothetical protein